MRLSFLCLLFVILVNIRPIYSNDTDNNPVVNSSLDLEISIYEENPSGTIKPYSGDVFLVSKEKYADRSSWSDSTLRLHCEEAKTVIPVIPRNDDTNTPSRKGQYVIDSTSYLLWLPNNSYLIHEIYLPSLSDSEIIKGKNVSFDVSFIIHANDQKKNGKTIVDVSDSLTSATLNNIVYAYYDGEVNNYYPDYLAFPKKNSPAVFFHPQGKGQVYVLEKVNPCEYKVLSRYECVKNKTFTFEYPLDEDKYYPVNISPPEGMLNTLFGKPATAIINRIHDDEKSDMFYITLFPLYGEMLYTDRGNQFREKNIIKYNLPSGKYNVRIYDSTGMTIINQNFEVSEDDVTETLHLNYIDNDFGNSPLSKEMLRRYYGE